MTFLSKAITAFGGLLLAHACYSAREHTALQSLRAATAASLTSTPTVATSLPVDIILETIISTFVILLGLVLGTRPLRPIEWRVWAGKIEREGEEGFTDNSGAVDKDFMGNPFSAFESRPNFVDIRKQRREFAEWVQKGGSEATRYYAGSTR
ncbi:magnesium transporter [Achaetomium macrosporum]|uniref:Magnesium transporter n=1 Tax=Achaetomium macrosporum TaxID=79813 RepID=A0AAN7H813_9PEZI|nr:magnesium transporter [Achaetomium macrosporum]